MGILLLIKNPSFFFNFFNLFNNNEEKYYCRNLPDISAEAVLFLTNATEHSELV